MQDFSVLIADESPGDFEAVLEINRRAFGQEEEAALVARLRYLGGKRVSLVAFTKGMAVGHILFTPVSIADAPTLNAYGLAPMAVLPGYQRQGIGAALISAGVDECVKRGIDAVFVLGHQEYYPRFGFVPAGDNGFHYASMEFDPHFFVRELKSGILTSKSGWVCYDSAFDGL